MPRKKQSDWGPDGGFRPKGDFRTPEQIKADAALKGAWWRCPTHGLTCDPLLLGGDAYCADIDCTSRVILVQKVRGDGSPTKWNAGPLPKGAL